MISKAIRILLLAGLLMGVAWIGVSVYANLVVFREAALGGADTHVPDVSEARYSVRIMNTGRTLYTDDCVQDGTTYTLRGYWELGKARYTYHDLTVVLDERYYGPILLRWR